MRTRWIPQTGSLRYDFEANSSQELGEVEYSQGIFGKYHTVGLSSDGKEFSWGAPTYGVLCREEVRDGVMETVPLPVPGKVLGELSDKTITDGRSAK